MELIVDRRYEPTNQYNHPYHATLTLKVTDEERELIENYGLGKHVLTQSRFSVTTVEDALGGARESTSSLDVLIGNENAMRGACEELPAMLDYCRSFGSSVAVQIS